MESGLLYNKDHFLEFTQVRVPVYGGREVTCTRCIIPAVSPLKEIKLLVYLVTFTHLYK